VALLLNGMSTLAIALFLLVAGMEVELSTMWRQGRTALGVALSGLLVPFALGSFAAWMAPLALGCEPDADPQIFALFLGTALAISALPLIARTLMDLNLYRSELGMVVIAAAVFNDLTGWIIFAVILGLLGNPTPHDLGIFMTIFLTLAFAGTMLTVGRWLIDRILPWVQAYTTWPGGVLSFAISLALLAAALTEWIGIHAIFGSFLVGVAIGDSRHLREQTRKTILDFVSFIFAPLFFASVGLRVDFADKFYPLVVVTVFVIACLGKILGCGLTARLTGMDWATSWSVGFAMNARGAMEIILGLLALQSGLIRQRMFVALVIMAIVTSMMSGPAIQRLLRRNRTVRFTDYMLPKYFSDRLPATDRREAVRELVRLVAADLALDTDATVDAVLRREQAGSTALGGQIAVPHARLAGLTRPVVAVGLSPGGIDFDAEDGQPARLVFLVLLPESSSAEHLGILADIARTFRDEHACADALCATSHTEFLAAVRAHGGKRPAKVAGIFQMPSAPAS
jgi:Kef-type K+ transport system membrane component KefB/mannitol/fructose-specific phosphotransferase system IIA component (Ntr-type)